MNVDVLPIIMIAITITNIIIRVQNQSIHKLCLNNFVWNNFNFVLSGREISNGGNLFHNDSVYNDLVHSDLALSNMVPRRLFQPVSDSVQFMRDT